MTCIVCKVKGCSCLFMKGAPVCFLCALGPKCPLEKKVEIEEKRNEILINRVSERIAKRGKN